MSSTLTSEANQRGLKDFLQLYNTITGFCFNKCVSNFNERAASGKETSCVDVCTENYVQYNQRFMFNFVDHQERRKRDQDAEAIEKAKQLEAQQLQVSAEGQTDVPEGDMSKVEQATQILETLSATSVAGSSGNEGQANIQSSLIASDSTKISSNANMGLASETLTAS